MKFYIIQSASNRDLYVSYQMVQESLGQLERSIADLKEWGHYFSGSDAMIFKSAEDVREWANTFLPDGKPYIIVECTGKVI